MKIEQLYELKKSITDDCTILPEGDYFKSAVLMPLIKIEDELCFLFEKRAANIRQGGEISFPGGEIDPEDESPMDAAVRETVEELRIEKEKISIQFKLGTLVSPRGVIVHTYTGTLDIDNITALNYDRNEVEKIFTIPVSFFEKNPPNKYKLRTEIKPYTYGEDGKRIDLFPAEKLNLPKKYHGKWAINDHAVLVYPTENETVWGLTAKLIFEFIKRLKRNSSSD